MKLSINVSTTREVGNIRSSEDGTPSSQELLNPKDEHNQSQNISLNVTDFNYKGSLQPLAKLINDWVEKNNK